MIKFLLDTNICVYILRKRPLEVVKRFAKLEPGVVGVSAITQFELFFGALKSHAQERNREILESFFLPLELIPFDHVAAEESARIRAELQHNQIGPMDLLIAGQGRALGLTLVTNNVREFERVRGLKVENWIMRSVSAASRR